MGFFLFVIFHLNSTLQFFIDHCVGTNDILDLSVTHVGELSQLIVFYIHMSLYQLYISYLFMCSTGSIKIFFYTSISVVNFYSWVTDSVFRVFRIKYESQTVITRYYL